jgi:hypothetical protein
MLRHYQAKHQIYVIVTLLFFNHRRYGRVFLAEKVLVIMILISKKEVLGCINGTFENLSEFK